MTTPGAYYPSQYYQHWSEEFWAIFRALRKENGIHEYTLAEGASREPPVYDGRRCLALSEMEEAGFTRDRYDRWRLPAALEPHLVERVSL